MNQVVFLNPETNELEIGQFKQVFPCPYNHKEESCEYCHCGQSAYILQEQGAIYVSIENVAFIVPEQSEQEGDIVIYDGVALGIVIDAYENTLKIYNEHDQVIQFIERQEVEVITFLVTELEKMGV